MRSLLLLLLLVASNTISASGPAPHGVVLMYHRFGEPDYPTTNVRMPQFVAHLDYLQQNDFTVWPLRKLLNALESGDSIPDKTVSITVDDAYLSFYTNAYPELKRRSLPATVFISTDSVDQQPPGYMNWKQLREMQQHGIDFANHGAAHLHMAHKLENENEEAWQARIRGDILRAERRLDEELGERGIPLFAYPFGEYNRALATVVQDMGYIAFGQHSGAIATHSDLAALPRFPINEHFAEMESFVLKIQSLPMPLRAQRPIEPQLDRNNPPELKLCLQKNGPVAARQVVCYLGSGRKLQTGFNNGYSLTVQASTPLPPGRSRYNCTALAGKERYYWFSQPWFNGPDPADPAY